MTMTHSLASAVAAEPPRVDIYAFIHKGLRAMMADTLLAVGCMDLHDRTDLQTTCQRVLDLADACTSHLSHENTFIHPAMEACQAESSQRIAHEHEEHLSSIHQLREAVARLQCTNGPAQAQSAQALYRRLATFVGENFLHMRIEETEHNRVLQAGYSDAELMALEGRIVASMTPEENLAFLRWMVPSMTPSERALLLGGMQAEAPAPVFAATLEALQPHLSARDWAKLEKELTPRPMAA